MKMREKFDHLFQQESDRLKLNHISIWYLSLFIVQVEFFFPNDNEVKRLTNLNTQNTNHRKNRQQYQNERKPEH